MKIISLNTWGGMAGKEKLLAFLEAHKENTDIFCLQEIWNGATEHKTIGVPIGGRSVSYYDNVMVEGLSELKDAFPEYNHFFHSSFFESWGLMLLVKRGVEVSNVGELFVHKQKGYVPTDDVGKNARNIQYVTIERDGKKITVINFHGLWNGEGKGDSEDRLSQSTKIADFLKTVEGEVVLCGDFNLLPETKSIAILEGAGLHNLIKEYKIESTRTELYDKKVGYADYIFVSKGLEVKKFGVLPDVVSDHAPLSVEVEL